MHINRTVLVGKYEGRKTLRARCRWEMSVVYFIGSQSVLRGSQRIDDQFPGDSWMHFCNGYCEVYLLLIEEIMFC
jgi:hypothetical protein